MLVMVARVKGDQGWADFTIMMECTPLPLCVYSVVTMSVQAPTRMEITCSEILNVLGSPCRRSQSYLGRWHVQYILLRIIKAQLCYRDVLSAHMSSKASKRGLIFWEKDTVLKILQSIVEKTIKIKDNFLSSLKIFS